MCAFEVAYHVKAAPGSGHCNVECAEVSEVALAGCLVEQLLEMWVCFHEFFANRLQDPVCFSCFILQWADVGFTACGFVFVGKDDDVVFEAF